MKSAKGRPDWEIREIAKSDDNPRNQEVGNSEIRSDAHAGRHSLYNGKQNASAYAYVTYSRVRVLVDSAPCKWYQFLILEKKSGFWDCDCCCCFAPSVVWLVGKVAGLRPCVSWAVATSGAVHF